jgi:hypothetical protein
MQLKIREGRYFCNILRLQTQILLFVAVNCCLIVETHALKHWLKSLQQFKCKVSNHFIWNVWITVKIIFHILLNWSYNYALFKFSPCEGQWEQLFLNSQTVKTEGLSRFLYCSRLVCSATSKLYFITSPTVISVHIFWKLFWDSPFCSSVNDVWKFRIMVFEEYFIRCE